MNLTFKQEKNLVLSSQLFDYNYYIKNNPDIVNKMDALEHYLIYGYKENPPREPFEGFNTNEFLKKYPQSKGINPLVYVAMNRINLFPKKENLQQKYNTIQPHLYQKPVFVNSNNIITKPQEDCIIKRKNIFEFNRQIPKTYNQLKPLPKNPKIGVVILTAWKKPELTKNLLEFYDSKPDVFPVLVDNSKGLCDLNQEDFNKVQIIENNEPFNFSKLNNFGVTFLPKDIDLILYSNDDLEVIQEDWLEKLIEPLYSDNSIGLIGPVALNPDNTLQGAGTKMRLYDSGVIGLNEMPKDLIEVQTIGGCCMLIRKELNNKVKGLREEFIITHSDTTLGLDVNNKGFKVIVNPFSKIKHYERSSRGKDLIQDTETFWSMYSKDILKYSSKDNPPKGLKVYYSNFLNKENIKSVCILKLDHFGDVSISLPVIDKLIDNFGKENITVVCGSWSVGMFKSLGITKILPVNFFGENGVTGGIKGLSENDKELLKKINVDLGIDLRVGSETRFILDIINAKIKVGYQTKDTRLDYSLNYESLKNSNIHNGTMLEILLSSIPFYEQKYIKENKDTIIINPCASTPVKSLNNTQWINIIKDLKKCNFKLFLTGSKNDISLLQEISKPTKIPILPFVPFDEYVSMISSTKNLLAYIGVDTGPSHLVALSGINVLNMKSGLVPHEEWASYGPNVITISKETYVKKNCYPCYNLSCQNRECLNFTPQDVLWSLGNFITD